MLIFLGCGILKHRSQINLKHRFDSTAEKERKREREITTW